MSTPTQERIKREAQGALARQAYSAICRRRAAACHFEAYALVAAGSLQWRHVGPILEEFCIALEHMAPSTELDWWRATCYGMFGESQDPCEAVLRALINWDQVAPL